MTSIGYATPIDATVHGEHRVTASAGTIQLALNGLDDVVPVSYVDGLRDGRGWAFRAGTVLDPTTADRLLAAFLWRYARELYSHPAFRRTTDLAAFTAPFAGIPDWTGAAA